MTTRLERLWTNTIGAGCFAFWCGVAVESYTQTPLLVLVGVLAP